MSPESTEFIKRMIAKHGIKSCVDIGISSPLGDKTEYHLFVSQHVGIDLVNPNKYDNVVVYDGIKLPFEDSTVTNVLLADVLEHAKNPFRLASEICRILKIGGCLITTNTERFKQHTTEWYNDYWRFFKEGILTLFSDFTMLDEEKIEKEDYKKWHHTFKKEK